MTAFNAHHADQMYRSEKLPAVVKPNNAPRPKRIINAIFPPLPPFLVAMDTIPPVSMRMERMNGA